ncbi:MAG: transposase, partial [Pseudonocardia sp.]|nr:transposase [Pseudonocardia sp.]
GVVTSPGIESEEEAQVIADQLDDALDAALESAALPAGRQLLISADFWTAYQSLSKLDGVDPLWCWAHIRRYFLRAGDAHPELAGWATEWVTGRIGVLYAAHAALAAADPGSAAHTRAVRAFEAVLAEMDTVRRAQAADPDLPAPARKVLATLDREWDGLARHREFPELDLDNNRAERAIRGPVVGRKNYYGSGAVWAAELAGRAWTVTATAALAGASPLTYLTDYLHACAAAGGTAPTGPDLHRFLPWAASEADLARWAHPAGGPGP